MDSRASIIVRTTGKRPTLLDQALFSIYGNNYPDIEVVIVAQIDDQARLQQIQCASDTYSSLGLKTKIIVNNTSYDQRSKNLNLGITEATGRYIGFLDDDDILYPDHISSLVNVLKGEESAPWVYSECVAAICSSDASGNLYCESKKFLFSAKEYSITQLWMENFIPIHSYLIDRNRIHQSELYFDESFDILEDYSFLLRFSALYRPTHHPKVTCEYRLRLDGSNSNYLAEAVSGIESSYKQKVWGIARSKICDLRTQILSYSKPELENNSCYLRTVKLLQQFYEESTKNFAHNKELIESEQSLRAELAQTRTELAQTRTELAQTHTELAQTHTELAQTQWEVNRLRERIEAMESSKFWKTRKIWMKFKRLVYLPTNE